MGVLNVLLFTPNPVNTYRNCPKLNESVCLCWTFLQLIQIQLCCFFVVACFVLFFVRYLFIYFGFNCFHPLAEFQAHLSSGDPQSYRSSAPLVFQNIESFLVLGLKGHDEVVRGDLAPAVVVHLAHEHVVQAW